jgi:hypothetical protein
MTALRFVFTPGEPDDEVRVDDVRSALDALTELFAAAWLFADRGPELQPPPESPVVLRAELASPLELLLAVPPEHEQGGGEGLFALLTLTELIARKDPARAAGHAAALPIGLPKQWEHYRALRSRWEGKRTPTELRLLDRLAEVQALKARQRTLRMTQVALLDDSAER